MEAYSQLIGTLALTMGVSWASGVNLYAALLVLGIGGSTGNIDLPPELAVVQDPMVIAAAGLMYFVEFFVDKTPGADTVWDGLHTFIRIPAGAMLAASAVGDVTPALQVAAGLMGGSVAAATHATKAGTRMLVNTSPEPFSNWTLSIGEDLAVIGGLFVALNHPALFLVAFVLFIVLVIWLLPKLWRALRLIFGKVKRWLSGDKQPPNQPPIMPNLALSSDAMDDLTDEQLADQLAAVEALYKKGSLTKEEFSAAKRKILGL
ncbi:uncharacterized protein DUF4126 [Sinobacterium caligoides]|uniref:Uncharacterized protein DUF4126 n=1 Tax=Sinobacterium caligoides TaxID=933926 RepID=A0A3N2DXS6_9GAMM|nr:DUF4126 family protein [Sinobacterium caligoides]ROS04631.1 uncharacterized protein DUF4126 [Sinobacterium caligoides]